MKRFVALLLCMILTFTGCSAPALQNKNVNNNVEVNEVATETNNQNENQNVEENIETYTGLNDPKLLEHIEKTVYEGTIDSLNDGEYIVQDVKAQYISKEYIDELAYNGKSNLYYGYTLEELDKQFQGNRYIFTLGDDGQTTVQELQELNTDDSYKVMKNVAIGTGVILVTVTASTVATVAGAPTAVTAVLVVSAKSSAVVAAASAGLTGTFTAIYNGYKTGDMSYALDKAVLNASEDYKMGAITGAATGALTELGFLKIGTQSGLTLNEVAELQKKSHYSLKMIKRIHSVDEFNVYKNSNLKEIVINNKKVLFPKDGIDLDYILDDGKNLTNLQRMDMGLAPIDKVTKKPFELHHIGQKVDSPFAVLNNDQHHKNDKILHYLEESDVHKGDNEKIFKKAKQNLWKTVAKEGEKIW